MRIDLPCCPLKYCRYQNDGNCTDKSRYESCPLREMVGIPDNATNGDVIKDVFKDRDLSIIQERLEHMHWWNAPYKRGDGE